MRRFPFWFMALVVVVGHVACASAQPAPALADPAAGPATRPAGVGKLPGITVDAKNKQIRVDAEALQVDMRLEFFCVLTGTSEHESLLRTTAKPSDIHTALLMLGLKPGEPVKYSEAAQKWTPPHGPPLQITIEYEKDGKTVAVPAYRMFRNATTKKTPPAFTWIFAGSRVMDDGNYAADTTGYIVSLVNFDLTLIDVPEIASNANETLEWEYNPVTVPKTGTKVTMLIEPAGRAVGAVPANPAGEQAAVAAPSDTAAPAPPATQPAGQKPTREAPISDVQLDEQKVAALKSRWERIVRPNANALRKAAQAHYEVIGSLRKEQQRLISEADRIQRAIDELEKDYQTMTTPQPEQ